MRARATDSSDGIGGSWIFVRFVRVVRALNASYARAEIGRGRGHHVPTTPRTAHRA
ncbi:hypothetical protein AB0E78_16485 [Streptomyces sp. NPDC032198]|uniref:hypothetical protein n=1 Tax=Streptomyces sp. NPDC032198 TaxID=3155127 RepID=UPI0033F55C20